MSLSYLDDQIKIDSGMLVKPVLDLTVARKIINPLQILSPSDQEVTVETLTRDIVVATGMDPLQARRASNTLVRNTFEVPVFDVEVQHGYDEYVRIAKTKYPTNALLQDVGLYLTINEDAMFFNASAGANRPGDGEGICADSNFRAPTNTLDLGTYAEAVLSFSQMLGDLMTGISGQTGMGAEVFSSPSYLVVNPDVWVLAGGLVNTYDGKTCLEKWNEMLKVYNPGGRVVMSEYLACTLAVAANGVIVITKTSSNAALINASPKAVGIYSSIYDIRQDPLSKTKGFYAKIVYRWLPLIHNQDGVIFEDGVTMTA